MTAVRGLLIAGVALVVIGTVTLGRSIVAYLSAPLAASSTSGVRVFRMPDGSLGGFEPFALATEPFVIGVGLLLVVAAAFLGAALREPQGAGPQGAASSRTRASTAGSNADAQMR